MIRSLPLKLVHFYVLLSVLVFLVVQGLKFFSIEGPDWVFHHLNDFLLIPIVALLALHAVWFLHNDRSIRLNILTIFSLVLLFALVFEYDLPKQSYRYTSDLWDVIAYFLGGIVFYLLQKIP